MTVESGIELLTRLQAQVDAMQSQIEANDKKISAQESAISKLGASSIATTASKDDKREKVETKTSIQPLTEKKQLRLDALKKVKKLEREQYLTTSRATQEIRVAEETKIVNELTLKLAHLEELEDPDCLHDDCVDHKEYRREKCTQYASILDTIMEAPSSDYILKRLRKNKAIAKETLDEIGFLLEQGERAERILKGKGVNGFIDQVQKEIAPRFKQQDIAGKEFWYHILRYLNNKIKKQPDILLQEQLTQLNRLWDIAQKREQIDAPGMLEVAATLTTKELQHVELFTHSIKDATPESEKLLFFNQKQPAYLAVKEYFLKNSFDKKTYLQGLDKLFTASSECSPPPDEQFFANFFRALRQVHGANTEKVGLIGNMESIIRTLAPVAQIVKADDLAALSKALSEMNEVEKLYYSQYCKQTSFVQMKTRLDVADQVAKKLAEVGQAIPPNLVDSMVEGPISSLDMIFQYMRSKKNISEARLKSFRTLCEGRYVISHIESYLKARKGLERLVNEMHKHPEGGQGFEPRMTARRFIAASPAGRYVDELHGSHLLDGELASVRYLETKTGEIPAVERSYLEEIDHRLKYTLSSIQKTAIPFPERPAVSIDSLLTVVDETEFPADFPIRGGKVQVRRILSEQIRKIKERVRVHWTPSNEEERTRLYDSLETLLCCIVHELQTAPNTQRNGLRLHTLELLCKGADFAEQMYFSVDAYNFICASVGPDLKRALFAELDAARVKTIIQSGSWGYIFKHFGKEFGTLNAHLFQYIDTDQFAAYNPRAEVTGYFGACYTVTHVIEWCKTKLQDPSNSTFRNAFIEWNVAQMAADYDDSEGSLRSKYAALDTDIARLQAEGKSDADIKAFLKTHPALPCDVQEGETITAAVIRVKEAAKRDFFVTKEVYEDRSRQTFKSSAICKMLEAFDVIQRR